ncbi:MAG TPA: fibronectin type III domain-containing protein [Candidatus Paceibacterota bacterium]|nr:fibronectin type III domain-containing protein [Verrucomicrobiota bacterium]HRY48475.1 fibronectin type III domain-containing protein [Candidatus Paceibacterota bacterium]
MRILGRVVVAGILAALPVGSRGQSAYSAMGGEYLLTDHMVGDQVLSSLALGSRGGVAVWQDNGIDGHGSGIGAQLFNASVARVYSPFRVNSITKDEQENPQAAPLRNGGTVFVWQGGKTGFQKIYARVLSATNTFLQTEFAVSGFSGNQTDPRVAVLKDGTVVVVWASFGQDGSLHGVFGQRLDANGKKLGTEFQVAQTSALNQRNPALTALANGGFAVAWISESPKGVDTRNVALYGVDVYVRLFDAQGKAITPETKINTQRVICANPAIASTEDGAIAIAWGAKLDRIENDNAAISNGWDIVTRTLDANGSPMTSEVVLNAYLLGDQYVPQLASYGNDIFAVWTSMGQDGSWEGVFGRFLKSSGELDGIEFQVNRTIVSRQMQPSIASDGSGRFLIAWSAFTEGVNSFELVGIRYGAAELTPKPSVLFVSALSQSRLSVNWPEMAGLPVDHYELYVDSSATPILTTNNQYTVAQLVPGSTHSFQLAYQLTDGRKSPMSDPITGTTWGEDLNADGLPDDWQSAYWGNDPASWPAPTADSDGDGVTNQKEFLAGTQPTDASSVLRIDLMESDSTLQLIWNTQPGLVYQVQVSTNVNTWENLGQARLAVGSSDSLSVDGSQGLNYYRVVRLR